MQNEEMINEFVAEAEAHVNTVENGLLSLENGEADGETINEIFRSLHSIKGTAGFFSLTRIVDLAHSMENLFSEIRKGNFIINDRAIDTLLEANDCLKKMIAHVEQSNEVEIRPHLDKIKGLFTEDDFVEVDKQETHPALSPYEQLYYTENYDNTEADGFFSAATKHGQKLYRLNLEIDRNSTPSVDKPPEEFVNGINSIGQLLQAFNDEQNWILVFNSVLETSLAAMALNIAEEKIIEIQSPSQLAAFLTITSIKPEKTNDQANHPSPDVKREPVEKKPIKEKQEVREEEMEAADSNQDLSFLSADNNREPSTQVESKVQPATEESIRVSVSLLNDLLNLASEMVLGRNQLLRMTASSRKEIPGLNTVLQNIDNLTTELQEKIMLTRMQPMSRVFNRFPRIVRELSKKTGKNVELSIRGQDVELDKSIVEGLGDPLTHLVRNSIDHGIEVSSIREKAGKPATGIITLHAYHEGGQVVIEIKDDGAGINLEKIKEKALESNLLTPAEIAAMGIQELYALLFRAGFSTATKVSDLSGRGVGLDVVKTNIEKLGGVMEIMSVLGMGTTFRLTMPLTLAIIPTIILEVSGHKFALPQVNLQEMVRVKASDPTKRIEQLGDAQVLRLREKLLPIVHLADVLGLERTTGNTHVAQPDQLLRVLIIKSGSKRFGLIVDLIHDGEEILVKQLPSYLKDSPCYSGVTILGDGMVAMILDPEGISNKAGLRFYNDNTEQLLHSQDSSEHMKEQQSLLLFQCSGPETFCVDISMVARVEKIRYSQLETIGAREFIQFRGESLRVIRPEDYLPVNRSSVNPDNYFVIIPKLVKYPMGILMHKIIANYDANIQFNWDEVKVKGLMGTAILSNQITLVINIYELFEMAAPELFLQEQKDISESGNIRVLLAEDTPFFLKLEKQYLEWAGYEVVTAINGKEAWDILQEEKIDLVISDIEMPKMNGFDLVKKIRSDQNLFALPVIAVTSRSDRRSREKGLEAGFDFYEVKLNKDKLLEKVRRALKKNES